MGEDPGLTLQEVGSPPVFISRVSGSDLHFEKIPLATVRGPQESGPSTRAGPVGPGTAQITGLNREGVRRCKVDGVRATEPAPPAGGVMSRVCVCTGVSRNVKKNSQASNLRHPAASTLQAPPEPSPILPLSHLLAPASSRRAPGLHPPTSSSLGRRSLAPRGLARPLSHPTPFLVRSSGPLGPGGPSWATTPRGPAEPARCSPGPPSPAPQPLSPQGRSTQQPRPPSSLGLSSPGCVLRVRPFPAARHDPTAAAPLTHQGADLGPAPALGSRRGSFGLRPPRLPETPPRAGQPGFRLLRFTVTLISLSSIRLFACHSRKGGLSGRGKRRRSPPR